jgi:hypothetical protein
MQINVIKIMNLVPVNSFMSNAFGHSYWWCREVFLCKLWIMDYSKS